MFVISMDVPWIQSSDWTLLDDDSKGINAPDVASLVILFAEF